MSRIESAKYNPLYSAFGYRFSNSTPNVYTQSTFTMHGTKAKLLSVTHRFSHFDAFWYAQTQIRLYTIYIDRRRYVLERRGLPCTNLNALEIDNISGKKPR